MADIETDQAYLDDDTPPWRRRQPAARDDEYIPSWERQTRAEPEVGTSPLAKQIEQDGTLDALAAEHQRSRKIAEATAFFELRKSRMKAENDALYGPQTPAIPDEQDSFGGEMFREYGRTLAGQMPKMVGGFMRQVAGSIADTTKDPEDPDDPNHALARGMIDYANRISGFGEENIRATPARRVEELQKIRTGSVKSFVKDTSDWLATQVGQAVGFGGPMLAGGMVLGLPGLAATAFPINIGEVRNTLEEEGITDPALLQSYGWIAGTAVGALDAIVPAQILTHEVKAGLAKYLLVRMAKTAGKIGTEEALTEGMQEAIEIAAVAEARGLSVGEDRISEAVYNMGRELYEKRWQIAELAAGGFVGGVTLGSGRIAQSAAKGAPSAGRTEIEKGIEHTSGRHRGPFWRGRY